MSRRTPTPVPGRQHLMVLVAITALLALFGPGAGAQTFTTLLQLTQALATNQVAIGKLDLKATVCAASRPKMGVLIVQDASGVELLQLGDLPRNFQPGERIQIQS